MKTLAAVLVEPGRPLELVELEIPALAAGQVLVQIAVSGVCHTQLLEVRGLRGPDPYLPHCLGHEASGTVLEVGSGVTRCRPGDRVLLSWIKGPGHDVPGTCYRWNGRTVNAGGVTTFSRHAVVSENRLTVLPETIDDRAAALLGCAVATGFGSVVNTAAVRPGQSVAVWGTGGVGLCAVAAAVLCGAMPVVAIDLEAKRLEAALRLGATATIRVTDEEPVEQTLQSLCPAGLDIAVESSGRPEIVRQALQAVRPRGGTVVVVGNAPFGQRVEIDPRELNQGKRLLGTWGGDNRPEFDFPRYVRFVESGRLNLDPFLHDVYPLEEINRALDDLAHRRAIRPLIDMRLEP